MLTPPTHPKTVSPTPLVRLQENDHGDRMTSISPWMQLKEVLGEAAATGVPADEVPDLEGLIANVWPEGVIEGGMTRAKLLGRTVNPAWNPPKLTFEIERHGAAAFGSTRAEVQLWCIDVAHSTVKLAGSRTRQLVPTQPRLDVKALAADAADLIARGADDPRLVWARDRRHVRVLINEIVPSEGPKQTAGDRRKRFRDSLEQLLDESGWTREERRDRFSRTG